MRKGVIDWDLSDWVDQVGGFSTTLSWPDRLRLRAIVKKVHLLHFPDPADDLLADRVIDVMGPETVAYLIMHNEGK